MAKKQRVMAPPRTAVIYARFSSHNQREESIDAQVRACMDHAQKMGLQVVKVYTDSAKSGTNTDRDGFLQMIEDSGKGQFEYLLIHKLDRFSRDKFDAVTFKKKLKINGVTLLSVTENLDGSPESKILESLLEGINQYYSENLAREVMKGMKESAYKCTHLGGIPPLGYDVDPASHKYVVNEVEASVVRTIFERYADGVGYNQLLTYLNGMGYRTKRGLPFGKNSLYGILQNEKYVGRFIFNKKLEKDISGKRNPQVKPKEDWIICEGGLPAIIDEETFNKVQTKMEYNRHNGGHFKAREIYLLSGLVHCGECNSSMYGNTRKCGRNKSRYSSYRCSNRANHKGCENKELRREYLDNYVLDQLYRSLFSEASIKKLATMLNDYALKKATESNEALTIARKELESVTQKIGKIVQLVSESGVAIDTVKGELKRLEERKNFIEDRIQEMSLEGKASLITEWTILELIERSKEFVRTKNIPECRNFITSYVEKVIVHKDRVEIFFKIQVPNETMETVSPLSSGERIGLIQQEYKTPSLYQ